MTQYSVKEIYYTLQGEGAHSGRPAIFLRFSGCNLWNGLEKDRSNAICQFCDTDFWGTDGQNGGKYTATELAKKVASLWPESAYHDRFVVCTGGEPMLQLDDLLIDALHHHRFEVACETNGTLPVPQNLDWICMSPKANTELVLKSGNEIKIIFPQKGIDPKDFEIMDFEHFFLQPMDDQYLEKNIQATVAYCKKNPKWKLSLQIHKLLQIP
jgi:7-carboxy-7-deazaguanine synthase (Cx14CxxC type)